MRPPVRLLIATLTALVVLLQVFAPGLHRLSHRHDDAHTAAAHAAHHGCSCEHHTKRCRHDPKKGEIVLMPGDEAVLPCAFCVLLARCQPWLPADPIAPIGLAAPCVGAAPMPRAPPIVALAWSPSRPRAPPIS